MSTQDKIADILIVDDEAEIRNLIAGVLSDDGYETRVATGCAEAFSAIEDRIPRLILLDIWLQNDSMDGLRILEQLKENYPEIPVVMISGHGNIDMAVSSIKKGAYDFIEKPFRADHLIQTIRRVIETTRLRRENQELLARAGGIIELVGKSPAVMLMRQTVEKIAPTSSRILITGPIGSGKEMVARLIHARSKRAAAPFIALNAATMTPERVEQELFGIEEPRQGIQKVGLLEQAHGGTLFLDEIGKMPLKTQKKTLRVLVEQRFQRVGGSRQVQVDVRIISSSSRNLEGEIEKDRFSKDLYHRLNVTPIGVPPLTDRRADIPALVENLIERICTTSGLAPRRIGNDALAVLQSYTWPGNIRQLRNYVERLMILANGNEDIITATMLPNDMPDQIMALPSTDQEHIMAMPLRAARESFERDYLQAQVKRFGGNISKTADFIGMERSALHRKLKFLGISNRAHQDT
ncbi:MAG: sigma-54 dependent transcriptional regulator [Parvularculales bacterium]